MKKKVIISAICIFVLLAIFFTPIYKGTLDDGGTRVYKALTYTVVSWNRIMVDTDTKEIVYYTNTSVYFVPHNNKDIDTLWQMETEKANNK